MRAPDWQQCRLPAIQKQVVAVSSDCSPEQADQWRQQHNIKLQSRHPPPSPMLSFSDCQWPGAIVDTLTRSGISQPTPVQAQSCPIVLAGHDLVAVAQTGSGKTLAYTLPAVTHLFSQTASESAEGGGRADGPMGPGALVLAPTRELVQQINHVVQRYVRCVPSRLRSATLYGGASRSVQCANLADGCDLVVATPGRLLDIMCSGDMSVQRCSFLVMDEADRMLDMGFEPQIRQILQQIRPDRQTVMWSATWPKEIRQLASEFMSSDFALLSVGNADENGLVSNLNITQHVHVLPGDQQKIEQLGQLLAAPSEQDGAGAKRCLVFAATRLRCDWLQRRLGEGGSEGVRVAAVHGKLSQRQRDTAINQFRRGNVNVLVATDVAARGLDIPDVDMVINFDYPNTTADYIHRIGRTGRCGRQGTAHTLFSPEDSANAASLAQLLQNTQQQVPDQLTALMRQSPRQSSRQSSDRRPYRGDRQRRDTRANSPFRGAPPFTSPRPYMSQWSPRRPPRDPLTSEVKLDDDDDYVRLPR